MKRKNFNMGLAMGMFIIGALLVLSDGASVTANVIGSTGEDAAFTSMLGLLVIIGSIGLFIVSMHSTDHHHLDLERMVRGTKHHEDLTKKDPEEEKGDHQHYKKDEE